MLDNGAGRDGNWRNNRENTNYTIEIGQNTEKSPGDLRKLAVTQSPGKNNQLTLVLNNNNARENLDMAKNGKP